MTNSYAKKREAMLRSEGRCTRCGKKNSAPKYAICPECREKDRVKHNKLMAERIRQGLCIYCGKNKALPNSNSCGCKETKDKKRVLARKSAGLCIRCGKNPVDTERSKNLCSECLKKNSDYMRKYLHEKDI